MLSLYKDELDKKVGYMRTFCGKQDYNNLSKFSKDIKIININLSTTRYKESNNMYLLRRKLQPVKPWDLVQLKNDLIILNINKKINNIIYSCCRNYWRSIINNNNILHLSGIEGFIAKH